MGSRGYKAMLEEPGLSCYSCQLPSLNFKEVLFFLKQIRSFDMNTFNQILRRQLASQLQKIRLDRNASLQAIALDCDLSLQNVEAIENAEGISFKKYQRLIRFYKKNYK